MLGRRPICSALIDVWIANECEMHASNIERAGVLYDRWRRFAHDRGREPGSPAEFAAAMEHRGFVCDRLTAGDTTRIRWGIRLKFPGSPP